MINIGKTIFNWKYPAICGKDYNLFATKLLDAGFEGVLLKAGDGNTQYRLSSVEFPFWGLNVRPEAVAALRAVGIKVYLWHFVYGVDITGEALVAEKNCDAFAPDGYIWDVEGAFDSKALAAQNARTLTRKLALSHPNVPQYLCWWALPKNPANYNQEWHPVAVAQAFLEICNAVMPMMYWGGSSATEALTYLNKSLAIWSTITKKPLIPVGRAYNGDQGTMDAGAVTSFAHAVTDKGFGGISWWVQDQAIKNATVWNALRQTPGFLPVIPPPPPVVEEPSDAEKLRLLWEDYKLRHQTYLPVVINK